MTSRQRFIETMRYGAPDRVPYFEEGLREEVLEKWVKQGLPRGTDIYELFPLDRREELAPDLYPRPDLKSWPSGASGLVALKKSLNPMTRGRLPRGFSKKVKGWRSRGHVLMLRAHIGFFLSMGVHNWKRFKEVILLTIHDPKLVEEHMAVYGAFAAEMAEMVLRQVEIDAAIFSEPIGGNDRPLISPKMYEDFVLRSYEPVLEVLRRYNVETIILRTYANFRILIPSILRWGFNCLWACEVNIDDMDYRDIRREFGRDLRLIGGIDLDVLKEDREAIRREVEEKVPPLIADGGYIPLPDGRVREDVPFENYIYYRELVDRVIRQSL